MDNNTIPELVGDYLPGHNLILNDTETREVHIVVNGKNQGANPLTESNILLTG